MNAAARRLLAEFTGDGALRLLVSAIVTALGLAVLILVFAPASGAHFNPLVTAADWALTRSSPARYGPGLAAAVMACQVAGAVGGAALADAMFAVPALAASRTRRGGGPVLLGEVVATAGLLLLIVTLARTGRTQHAAWSVGTWIGAAYWFTSSTSFANPAVTIGRTLTPTYAGIAPASAPAFITAEILGGGLGLLLAVAVHPAPQGQAAERQPVELAG